MHLNESQRHSEPLLHTPQSKSAVHYLSISPPRIKVTRDESCKMRSKTGIDAINDNALGTMPHRKETSEPETSLEEIRNMDLHTTRDSSSLSSGTSRNSMSLSLNVQYNANKRRSSYCLEIPNQYRNCRSKRRLSLPNTSHKFYYSGPTLYPPPITYNKLQSSCSSSIATESSSPKTQSSQKEVITGSQKSKRAFSSLSQSPSTPTSENSKAIHFDTPHSSSSFVKRQSSGSISSFSSQTESFVPSSSSSSNPTTATTISSSSSNEVPDYHHRSSCASIHSYSAHALSRGWSISDSRRSSGATDQWSRSFGSGVTSTRSRY